MSVTAPPTTRRRRSARGEGDRLREEILVATAALLARMGSDEALSLRAVAREVGVSAPSVYLHFPDKEALLLAVAAELFSEVERALDAAAAQAGDDPVATVVARARAYVEWGLEHPGQYKVLYEGALWRRLDHPQQQQVLGQAALLALAADVERAAARGALPRRRRRARRAGALAGRPRRDVDPDQQADRPLLGRGGRRRGTRASGAGRAAAWLTGPHRLRRARVSSRGTLTPFMRVATDGAP